MHGETLPKGGGTGPRFRTIYGPKFCSMEITQQVRDYAAKLNETPEMAAKTGMAEMSEKFREMGEKLYIDAKP
jgi:phosphomethylpyrimidine synthase